MIGMSGLNFESQWQRQAHWVSLTTHAPTNELFYDFLGIMRLLGLMYLGDH